FARPHVPWWGTCLRSCDFGKVEIVALAPGGCFCGRDKPRGGPRADKRRRKSLFSNTLVLPDFSALEAAKIDNPTKLNSAKQTLALYGRHLEGAVFYRADLRKAYFGDAYLQGASFYQAQLQSANFYQSKLQGANLEDATRSLSICSRADRVNPAKV